MQILKIEKETVFAFHDFRFFVFDKNSVIQATKGELIGYSWAIPAGIESAKKGIDVVLAGSNYHNMLNMTLLKSLSAAMDKIKKEEDSPE